MTCDVFPGVPNGRIGKRDRFDRPCRDKHASRRVHASDSDDIAAETRIFKVGADSMKRYCGVNPEPKTTASLPPASLMVSMPSPV